MNCYLLTGGLSSRMGRPKSELLLGGRTFLQRAIDAAAPVFDQLLAVTRRDMPAPPDLPAIVEPDHGHRSPLFGIEAALSHAGGKAWILALDYPLVTTDALRYLRERFDESPASLLVPIWSERKQMLCAGYDFSAVTAVREHLRRGEYKLRALTDACQTEYVTEEELRSRYEGELLWNVNAPDDFERLREMYDEAEEDSHPSR